MEQYLIPPPSYAFPAHFGSTGDFGLAQPSIQQLGGLHPPPLQLFEIPLFLDLCAHHTSRRILRRKCHCIIRRSVEFIFGSLSTTYWAAMSPVSVFQCTTNSMTRIRACPAASIAVQCQS